MPSVPGESRGNIIVIATVALLGLASVFTLARIYSRAWLLRRWYLEDHLVVFSWLLAIACTIVNCVQTVYGVGHHQIDIPIPAFEEAQKLQYINLLLYTVLVCTTKLSICFAYLRIFAVDTWRAWHISGCIVFIVLFSIVFEIVCIIQCRPIPAFWNLSKKLDGKCINTIPSFYAVAACNIVSDIWLMAIIVPRVLGLQIRRPQKILLLGTISLGWLVVIATIVRLVRISTILNARDKAWASYDINIWTALEVDVGIICASAPAIKPVLTKLMPHLMRSGISSSGQRDQEANSTPYGYARGEFVSYKGDESSCDHVKGGG